MCWEGQGAEISGEVRGRPARGKEFPGARTVLRVGGPRGERFLQTGKENRHFFFPPKPYRYITARIKFAFPSDSFDWDMSSHSRASADPLAPHC